MPWLSDLGLEMRGRNQHFPDSKQTSCVPCSAFCTCRGLGPRWRRRFGGVDVAFPAAYLVRHHVKCCRGSIPSRLTHYGLHSLCLRLTPHLAMRRPRLDTAKTHLRSSLRPLPPWSRFRGSDFHRLVEHSFPQRTCQAECSQTRLEDQQPLEIFIKKKKPHISGHKIPLSDGPRKVGPYGEAR